jgi:hypothetical protein
MVKEIKRMVFLLALIFISAFDNNTVDDRFLAESPFRKAGKGDSAEKREKAVAIFRLVFKRHTSPKNTAEDCHKQYVFIFLRELLSQ